MGRIFKRPASVASDDISAHRPPKRPCPAVLNIPLASDTLALANLARDAPGTQPGESDLMRGTRCECEDSQHEERSTIETVDSPMADRPIGSELVGLEPDHYLIIGVRFGHMVTVYELELKQTVLELERMAQESLAYCDMEQSTFFHHMTYENLVLNQAKTIMEIFGTCTRSSIPLVELIWNSESSSVQGSDSDTLS
jgi:hypothetical protein